jgi:putative membrane protein
MPTCETFATVAIAWLRPALDLTTAGRFSNQERGMEIRTVRTALAFAGWGLLWVAALPSAAASLSTIGAAQPLPQYSAREMSIAGLATAGSAALVPPAAEDAPARPIKTVDAAASGSATPPIDDVQFVKQATENGRKEIVAAQEALPQLKNPDLKHLAAMLATDHAAANDQLSRLAEAKGWPVPSPQLNNGAAPAGTASTNFDAAWTAAMIAGHERSAALFRAQAQGGEDKDLRKYARETLPTIEKHLAELRRLQK